MLLEKSGLLPERMNFTWISDSQLPDVMRKAGKQAWERLIVTRR
jgi:hypothetical protein